MLAVFKPAWILLFIILSACASTHPSQLQYEGVGVQVDQPAATISGVVVSDMRGTDSHWLGAIRGGYGNVLKRLETERSTDQVVDQMYTAALAGSGLYDPDGPGPYNLSVVINKFDCSYYFNREAHAHVTVTLSDLSRGVAVYSKPFKTDLTESGVGAGIFGDVDTLRDLAESAMNQSIDKMLADDEFIKLATSPIESVAGGSAARLQELDELLERGLITDEEYHSKRQDILSEL